MPRIGLFLQGILISALLAMPAAAQQQGFRWQQDIEAAKVMARQSGRLVLVHVWAPTCGPCMAMEQSVFNQPGVAGAIETYYVPVKLNAEDHAAAAQAFGVTRIPSDVVLSPDGNVIGKMISPSTPAAYVAELTQVATRVSSKNQPFTSASAEAPQPSHLNAAYAKLPIGTAAVPSASSPFPGSPGDHYAQSQFLPNPSTAQPPAAATANATSALFGAPASANAATGYTPTAYEQPLASAPSSPLPTGGYSAPGALTPPPAPQVPAASVGLTTSNPYAPAQPSAGYAAAGPAQPSQISNPYTFAAPPIPAAPASEPIAAYARPAAVAPPIASAPPTTPIPPLAPAPPQVTAGAKGTVATADGRLLPPGAPPLGFEGYCPVSMRGSWKWVAGDPKWGAIHRGRTYWFVGQAEQQQFLANPDYYSPALSGMDPVLAIDHRQAVPGQREHSIDYDNQFYLFSSETTLQQFTSNPERYATGVRQAMGLQPTRMVR